MRAPARHEFPISDIGQMLAEIERGYERLADESPSSTRTSRCTWWAGPHPHKADSQRLLESAIAAGERMVTDVEVLQEVLHRYVAIDRRDAIQPAYDVLEIVDEVYPVTLDDARRAKDIGLGKPRFSARDALHVAVMERHDVRRIMTFDTAFDNVPGLLGL